MPSEKVLKDAIEKSYQGQSLTSKEARDVVLALAPNQVRIALAGCLIQTSPKYLAMILDIANSYPPMRD